MKELVAIIRLTVFHRDDADAFTGRLSAELSAVQAGVYPSLTMRHTSPAPLRPGWLTGELAELPPHQIEMTHAIVERRGLFDCETLIGLAGPPRTASDDEELLPETLRAVPSTLKH